MDFAQEFYVMPPGDAPCIASFGTKGVARKHEEVAANANLLCHSPTDLALLLEVASEAAEEHRECPLAYCPTCKALAALERAQ